MYLFIFLACVRLFSGPFRPMESQRLQMYKNAPCTLFVAVFVVHICRRCAYTIRAEKGKQAGPFVDNLLVIC